MRHLPALASLLCLLVTLLLTSASAAQTAAAEIAADNLTRLRPYARIDFAELEFKPTIGWFAANEAASKFLLLGASGEVFSISLVDGSQRWVINPVRGPQAYALIDGMLMQDQPLILHQLDEHLDVNLDVEFQINERMLAADIIPVALFPDLSADGLILEATDENGQMVFLRYRLDSARGELTARDRIPFPGRSATAPVMRVGRISFPALIFSALAEGNLSVHLYSDLSKSFKSKAYELDKGPAVFGALNMPIASHFAWTNPQREQLNLLDLATGENRVVAALDGDYPQYLLLSQDSSVILAVNLDFQPVVVAWHVESGKRFELGHYRPCNRIPDKVALSRDGQALIIGCDMGLELWRANDAARKR